MAKRALKIQLSSPDGDITLEELNSIKESLNAMEDWQLTGERIESVQNYFIWASCDGGTDNG